VRSHTLYNSASAGLVVVTMTLALFLIATPDAAFGHAGWRPPAGPSGRPSPPPRSQSIQLIRDRLLRRGILLSQATLDRLQQLDPRLLDAMQRGLWRLYGDDVAQLTEKQRNALQGWLDNIIDRSGQIQAILDNADWYNDNAYIAENAGLAVSIGKGGVMIAAVVFNPAALPVLIMIEGTATKVEHGATFVGEFTAALQDGFTVENAEIGAKNASIAVVVRLAGGQVAKMLIPLDTVKTAAGNQIVKLGDKMLQNATRQQLRDAAAAWIGQEVTKTGCGWGANQARNLLNQPGKPDTPVVVVSRPFDLPPSTPADVPVQTVTRTFDLPPEMRTPQPAPAPPATPQQSIPTGADDPIGRVIEQSLRTPDAAAPPGTSSPPSAVESGLFDNPPTLPPPTPAPASTGNSGLPADVADLFVNKMPSSFPPTTTSGQLIAPNAQRR